MINLIDVVNNPSGVIEIIELAIQKFHEHEKKIIDAGENIEYIYQLCNSYINILKLSECKKDMSEDLFWNVKYILNQMTEDIISKLNIINEN